MLESSIVERVNNGAKEKLAVDAFVKCITEATETQDVYKFFDLLQGTATLEDSIHHIDTHLTEEHTVSTSENSQQI